MSSGCAVRAALVRHLGFGAGLFGLFLGLHFQQPFPVGDRDLVIIGVDFAEGEEAVPVAAIFDERGLQAGLDPDYLGKIDIAFDLLAIGRLDVEILKPVTIQHHHAGFFRVAGVDQHFFGH